MVYIFKGLLAIKNIGYENHRVTLSVAILGVAIRVCHSLADALIRRHSPVGMGRDRQDLAIVCSIFVVFLQPVN